MDQVMIPSKLCQPSVSRSVLSRPRLLELLDTGLGRDLTLVSAPPGFGKTTLVAQWLASRDLPTAWISLDGDDNRADVFMAYVTKAVRSVYPEACRETQSLLRQPTRPPAQVIADRFSAELGEMPGELVLVLDDFHNVRDMDVHWILAKVLQHPPPGLHLSIVTRNDPPLPLAALRARDRIAEIRRADLRFTTDETRRLFRDEASWHLSDESLSVLEEQLEGWPVGLRLLLRSMNQATGPDELLLALRDTMQPAIDYLASEMLSTLPADMQRMMIETSSLECFCAPLVDALCAEPVRPPGLPAPDEQPMNGESFISSLKALDLFIVPLCDSKRECHRFHAVLRTVLRRYLSDRYSEAERAELHRRALVWLQQEGMIGQALRHAETLGDWEAAGEMVGQARIAAVNVEDWPRIRRWVDALPKEVVEHSPELLVAWGFGLQHDLQLARVDAVADRAESLLHEAGSSVPQAERCILDAEIATLRSHNCLWRGEIDRLMAESRTVLDMAPEHLHFIRGLAELFLGLGMQMSGRGLEARQLLLEELERSAHTPAAYRARFLLGLVMIDWSSARLGSMLRQARRLLSLSDENGLLASLNWARFYSGMASYARDDSAVAANHFSSIVDSPYSAHPHVELHSHFGLALTNLAEGRDELAERWADRATAWALERGVPGAIEQAEAFHARMDLMLGRLPGAVAWAEGRAVPRPATPFVLLEQPAITWVQVQLARGHEPGLDKAADALRAVRQLVDTTHNSVRRIDVLVLEGLLLEARGSHAEALEVVGQAVALAEPAGIIRPFLDIRPSPEALLRDVLTHLPESTGHVRSILTARDASGSVASSTGRLPEAPVDGLLDPLTPRELEVLALLGQRLSNQEIAAELVVSTATVKTHAHNIYGKLDVRNRREAVERASELGLRLSD